MVGKGGVEEGEGRVRLKKQDVKSLALSHIQNIQVMSSLCPNALTYLGLEIKYAELFQYSVYT
jgi:hypothetical protein